MLNLIYLNELIAVNTIKFLSLMYYYTNYFITIFRNYRIQKTQNYAQTHPRVKSRKKYQSYRKTENMHNSK